MPRITSSNGSISQDPVPYYNAPAHLGPVGPDLDTADRIRDVSGRPAMHEMRDAEADIRTLPRTTSEVAWRRPTNLDAPNPRPGMVQRWVRAEMRSETDNLNWTSKLREGWRPRDPATLSAADAHLGLTAANHNGQGVIRVGGLILVEMEETRIQARRRAVSEQNRRQEASVSAETDKISREGQAIGAAPIVREERNEVSTGRRPHTMAN